MKPQILTFISRLKKPSVILSIVSQIVAILLLLGFNVNENSIMSIATLSCSMLVTLGIISNPDSAKKGYGDNLLTCSSTGKIEQHVMVDGQFICSTCGAVYDPAKELA